MLFIVFLLHIYLFRFHITVARLWRAVAAFSRRRRHEWRVPLTNWNAEDVCWKRGAATTANQISSTLSLMRRSTINRPLTLHDCSKSHSQSQFQDLSMTA